MFDKQFEERMTLWREFRQRLESAVDPIQDTIDFYNRAPTCLIAADPYTPSTWPDPWELLQENNYCSFVKILAICYTLQLTDVLSQASYEIHITQDNEKSETYYLLYVNDNIIGLIDDTYVHKSQLPKTAGSKLVHPMPPQQ
jgi:hypothetical protein